MNIKRICPIHGLYTKPKGQKTGCPTCKQAKSKEYDLHDRNKENDKFYHSREWKRARGLQLSKFPLCKECFYPAEIVDHIVEIKDGGSRLSHSNLQSLCRSCHNIKTFREKRKREGVGKMLPDTSSSTAPQGNFLQTPIRGGRA